ncbi:hypothetical protein F5Y18DRAFT_421648 [Xylariaceae sp. FL1019]|nr:hypothetical protein F5Y18DRAFT_421648 [Xylariaceae sp. FL1019]
MDDQMEAGSHPSPSKLYLQPMSNGSISSRSSAAHVESYRHSLLKSKAQHEQTVEKDLPVPPVLTQNTGPASTPATPFKQHSEGDFNQAFPYSPPLVQRSERDPSGDSRTPAVDASLDEGTRDDRSSRRSENSFATSYRDAGIRAQPPNGRLAISKVRPAFEAVKEVKFDREGHESPPNLALSDWVHPVGDHFRYDRMHIPKVRPFVDHEHSGQQSSSEVAQDVTEPINEVSQVGHTEKPSKPFTYWSLLPHFGEKQDAQRENPTQHEAPPPTPQPLEESSQPSISHPEPYPVGDGNLRAEENQSAHHSTENHQPIEDKAVSGNRLQEDSAANNAVPSTSGENSSWVPKKHDHRWTAAWLNHFLNQPEDESSNLTKLPERDSASRKARLSDDIGSLKSRMTSFSGQTAADKLAMEKVMKNLEHLLSEAAHLTKELSEKTHCGHIDDSNLPLRSTSEDSAKTYPQSVHESAQSTEDEREAVAVPLPPHYGAMPLNASSHKVAESVQPMFQDGLRLRNTSHNAKTRHSEDDDCILLMPPADRDLKRRQDSEGYPGYNEDGASGVIRPRSGDVPNSREVREYIRVFHQPPIGVRGSSRNDNSAGNRLDNRHLPQGYGVGHVRRDSLSSSSLDSSTSDEMVDELTSRQNGEKQESSVSGTQKRFNQKQGKATNGSSRSRTKDGTGSSQTHRLRDIVLRNTSHISLGEGERVNLGKPTKRRSVIARDWSLGRKRFVASVACISTTLIGVLIGIYAGLVPAIQYWIADYHHYAIIGNVALYLGMAVPTLFFWPLPLLHGRKPYIVGSMCVAMPLLFPQAIAVSTPRSPTTSAWRIALLLPRGLMGCALGFASMNFHSILTDLFGASLMSSNPHQELVDDYDIRRHGGGLGCFIGSLSVGFVVGAVVIDRLQPAWGFYICIIIAAVVLLLNVLCPEVRRSGWRRSIAEVRRGTTLSRRLARGEIMMHRIQTGPKWWGQEVYHGVALILEMLRQPGFTIMAIYYAWIYAQVVLIIVLLGSLTSKTYRYRSPYVGAAVSSVAIGALVAIPFQKANIFSRARSVGPLSNHMTFDKTIQWTSHLVRRAIFTLILPVAGIVYTFVSTGPPIHVVVPSFLAALIGFLSCLAISECTGLLMETWDCSDLQAGMTGPKPDNGGKKRTNYSSFPRVTAGWNFIQGLGFIFAAGATGLGGLVTRRLGQQEATGIVAGILLILSLLLLLTVARFKKVQIIPNCSCAEMDRWTKQRRVSLTHHAAAVAAAKSAGNRNLSGIPEEDVDWKPAVPGHPVDRYRRINILELGSLTRWSEIRKLNRLTDENAHLNKETFGFAQEKLHHGVHHSAERLGNIARKISKKSLLSRYSHEEDDDDESKAARNGHTPISMLNHRHHQRESSPGETEGHTSEDVEVNSESQGRRSTPRFAQPDFERRQGPRDRSPNNTTGPRIRAEASPYGNESPGPTGTHETNSVQQGRKKSTEEDFVSVHSHEADRVDEKGIKGEGEKFEDVDLGKKKDVP